MKEIGLLGILLGSKQVSESVGIDENKVIEIIKNSNNDEFFSNLQQKLIEATSEIGVEKTSEIFSIDPEWLKLLHSDEPNIIRQMVTNIDPIPEKQAIVPEVNLEVEEWYIEDEFKLHSNIGFFAPKKHKIKASKIMDGYQKAMIVAEAVSGGSNAFVDVGNKYNIDSHKIRSWCISYQKTGDFKTSQYKKRIKVTPLLEQALRELENPLES